MFLIIKTILLSTKKYVKLANADPILPLRMRTTSYCQIHKTNPGHASMDHCSTKPPVVVVNCLHYQICNSFRTEVDESDDATAKIWEWK